MDICKLIDKYYGSERGFVYFITDKEKKAIKIGVSNNPGKRISILQIGNSSQLKLLHAWCVDNLIDAKNVEQEIHKKLDRFRIRGEWFEGNAVFEFLRPAEIIVGDYSFCGFGPCSVIPSSRGLKK